MNKGLPDGLVAYKRTPVFDEKTIPAGLMRGHSTKAGVWGTIHVLHGELLYRVIEPPGELIVNRDSPLVVIRPQEIHEVALRGPVLFYVEFHAAKVETP
jgi:tellurite resistance-related uncharacterized protein